MTVIERIIDTEVHYAEREPCRTAEQMEKVCCDAAKELGCCEIDRPWSGYTRDEILEKLGIEVDENGLDENGREVVVEFVHRERDCGKQRLEYDTTPKSCCVGTEPLADPFEDLVVGDDSSVLVTVSGGKGPYYWRVRAANVWLDANHSFRDGMTAGPMVRIYTGTVCGVIPVEVSDGCSTAMIYVRAESGHWQLLDYWDYRYDHEVPPPCLEGGLALLTGGGVGQQYDYWEIYDSGQMVKQTVDKKFKTTSVYKLDEPWPLFDNLDYWCPWLESGGGVPVGNAFYPWPPCSGEALDYDGCPVEGRCYYCSDNRFFYSTYESVYSAFAPAVLYAWHYRWEC